MGIVKQPFMSSAVRRFVPPAPCEKCGLGGIIGYRRTSLPCGWKSAGRLAYHITTPVHPSDVFLRFPPVPSVLPYDHPASSYVVLLRSIYGLHAHS